MWFTASQSRTYILHDILHCGMVRQLHQWRTPYREWWKPASPLCDEHLYLAVSQQNTPPKKLVQCNKKIHDGWSISVDKTQNIKNMLISSDQQILTGPVGFSWISHTRATVNREPWMSNGYYYTIIHRSKVTGNVLKRATSKICINNTLTLMFQVT